MTMSRNALQFCAALGALLYGAAAPAQGLLTEHRLAAGLANEAVAEAVAACAKNGYTVTAIVVDIDGVRQAVLRGDGAPVHTLDSAYAKAYTAASLAPVRKDDSTKAIFERLSKNPSTTASLGNLPNVTFTPGGVTKWRRASRSAASASAAPPAAISTTIAPAPRSTRSKTG
jgi:uncharacterized protein GlcG (DUF336 family)